MVVRLPCLLAAACLLLVTGCVTDELVVFKKNLLDKEELKPLVGVYQVERWPGDMKPEVLRVTPQGEGLEFSYTLSDKRIAARFMLSKIPGSKKDLHLLSVPAQKDTNQANMFFISKTEEQQTRLWAVFGNLPVAEGRLAFDEGKAKAEDVKKFLRKHADQFVAANTAQVLLQRREP